MRTDNILIGTDTQHFANADIATLKFAVSDAEGNIPILTRMQYIMKTDGLPPSEVDI